MLNFEKGVLIQDISTGSKTVIVEKHYFTPCFVSNYKLPILITALIAQLISRVQNGSTPCSDLRNTKYNSLRTATRR
jgi:hypothetical protein